MDRTARSDFPVAITLPIQWGDQDAFGHVNNTVPIRWFESARIAYLERVGLWHALGASGIGPILAAVHCNYRRQLKHPDAVTIGARVAKFGRTSFTMEHAVWSEAHGGEVAVDGDSVIVVFDYRGQRPVQVPTDLYEAIERLEGRK